MKGRGRKIPNRRGKSALWSKIDLAFLKFIKSKRPIQNEESWHILTHKDSGLWQLMETVRKNLKIPNSLNPTSDLYTKWVAVEGGDTDLVESQWIDSLNSKLRDEVSQAVDDIIVQSELPIDFDDRIRYWLLYGKPQRAQLAPFGLEQLVHILQNLENSKMLRGISLDAQEKNFLRWYVRNELGIKTGRSPRKYTEFFNLLNNFLSGSKNTQRRHRIVHNAIAALRMEDEVFLDDADGLTVTKKKTFKDLAGELYPIEGDEFPTKEEDEKIATRIRVQKSRHLKRIKNMQKKLER